MANITLREWIKNYKEGKYSQDDYKTQCEAGWYDWFCKTSTLRSRLYKMAPTIIKIKDGGKLDFDKMYVFFKNNCPVGAPTYDSFKFCNMESGEVIYCIDFDHKEEIFRYTVWGRENEFQYPLYQTDYARDLIKWFSIKKNKAFK